MRRYYFFKEMPISCTGMPSLSQNPALLTATNKDNSELYHELMPFDAALAQETSDRGVNILRATQAQKTLPRIAFDPNYFESRFCDRKEPCWTGVSRKEGI
jgi:hypothetical protein